MATPFSWFRNLSRKAGSVIGRTRRLRYSYGSDIRLDSDYRALDLYQLQLDSIDFYSRNSLARALVDVLQTNVIGPGLRPYISLDHLLADGLDNPDRTEKQIMDRFDRWANSRESDYHRQTTWYDLQRQAYLGRLLLGGIFSVLRIENGRYNVQLIDYFRCRGYFDIWGYFVGGSKVARTDGIEYDERGREKTYNFDGSLHKIDRYAMDGREQLLHYYRQSRAGQLRGIPIITPVLKDLKDLNQYKEYEIKAAIVAASFTVFITSQREDPLGSGKTALESKYGQAATEKLEEKDFDTATDYAMRPGAIYALDESENITVADPKRPNQSFKDFYDTVVRDLAAAVGIPMEILLRHFNTSFTAARAANLEFQKTINIEREHFAPLWCQPQFEQWLDQEVRSGRIKIDNYYKLRESVCGSVRWVGPAQGQINEKVAATAAKERIDAGLSTRERETIELGTGDFWRNADKLRREQTALPGNDDESAITSDN